MRGTPSFPPVLRKMLSENWSKNDVPSEKPMRRAGPSRRAPVRSNGADRQLNVALLARRASIRLAICRTQPSIRLLPFAFCGLQTPPRSLPHDSVHDHAGGPKLLLDLAPHPRFSFFRWRLAVPYRSELTR